MDELLLTDDEAVALAIDGGTYWPGDLPTVDGRDASALATAAFRGERSLLVRGLLTPKGQPRGELRDLCSSLLGCSTYVVAFLANDLFRRAGWGVASAHFPSGETWIFETLTPTGVHHLFRQTLSYHQAYLVALLTGAREAGPGPGLESADPTVPTALCILATAPTGAVLATARRGDVRVGAVRLVDGAIVPHGDLTPVAPDEAVTSLMRAAQEPGPASPRFPSELPLS